MGDKEEDVIQFLQALLEAQAGVRKAIVVRSVEEAQRENVFAAYILPDEEYIDRTFPEDEVRRVKKWSKVFDLTQLRQESGASQAEFNIAGWNSSYTRQPIPPQEMHEWVDRTVQSIVELQPRNVLEIGCGTGLLLLRLAGRCSRYVGTDIAPVVLKKLREQMSALPTGWDNVTLLERPAENFEGFGGGEFDAVVMNSVVKYFPNAAYLTRVMEGALRAVRPGGAVFVGDVRNLWLLWPYAFSIEFFQAPAAMSLADLLERIHRRVVCEDQLVVSPAFFVALQERLPELARVEIRLKQGQYSNEMTRFRFDAVLRRGDGKEAGFAPRWMDWEKQELTLDSISAMLQKDKPERLAIRGIRNARVEKDVSGLAALKKASPSSSVGQFKEMLDSMEFRGIDPQAIWSMAGSLGYRVDLSWKAARADGSFDAFFWRPGVSGASKYRCVAWPDPVVASQAPGRNTNAPGSAGRREKFIEQLSSYIQQSAQKEVGSINLILVDEFPVTADGRVDLKALPVPAVVAR
jgi:SAM-dependent methyltransferase